MNDQPLSLIRVSGDSSPFKAAGAIAAIIRERRQVAVQAIGAAALNQAMKAIIYARRYVEQDQLDLIFIPSFQDIELEGAVKTAVRLEVLARPLAKPEAGQPGPTGS